MDWGKRVQFVLGTERDKGHVLISSPAMRKCDWTEWVGRETMAGLVNGHSVSENGVFILIITRKGRIEKEGDETLGCSTVGAFAGSTEQAIHDLFTQHCEGTPEASQIPPPTLDCHQKFEMQSSELEMELPCKTKRRCGGGGGGNQKQSNWWAAVCCGYQKLNAQLKGDLHDNGNTDLWSS